VVWSFTSLLPIAMSCGAIAVLIRSDPFSTVPGHRVVIADVFCIDVPQFRRSNGEPFVFVHLRYRAVSAGGSFFSTRLPDRQHRSGSPGAPVLRSGTGAHPQMRQVTFRISVTTDSGYRVTGDYYRKPKKVKSEKMGA
jgi:hypothetical protein